MHHTSLSSGASASLGFWNLNVRWGEDHPWGWAPLRHQHLARQHQQRPHTLSLIWDCSSSLYNPVQKVKREQAWQKNSAGCFITIFSKQALSLAFQVAQMLLQFMTVWKKFNEEFQVANILKIRFVTWLKFGHKLKPFLFGCLQRHYLGRPWVFQSTPIYSDNAML